MLSLYRRHADKCRYSQMENPQEFTKCTCPIWAYGFLNGKEIRRSLKMRDWKRAEEKILTMNTPGGIVVTVKDAVDSFVKERRRKKRSDSTIDSHEKAFVHLVSMYGSKGLSSVTVDMIDKLQDSRTYMPNKKGSTERAIAPGTLNKELKTLRALFTFAKRRKWCDENPAAEVGMAADDKLPTLPFEPAEVEKIIEACGRLDDDNPERRDVNRRKALARVLLLLYTGLRISDIVRLERSKVDLTTGQILIRMMKTRKPLYIRLPKIAVEALASLPETNQYFLWSGESTMHTATSNARKSIQRVCKIAGVSDGHPHRFRDTFAVELLKNGATLHTVQLLLGHDSIRTTEKHYAPYVLEYQGIIDAATSKLSFGSRTKNRTLKSGDEK